MDGYSVCTTAYQVNTMVDAVQLRMARVALGWTLRDLSKLTGIDKNTLSRLEGGRTALSSTFEKVQQIFEKNGVVFLHEDDAFGPGVRLRKSTAPKTNKRR